MTKSRFPDQEVALRAMDSFSLFFGSSIYEIALPATESARPLVFDNADALRIP